MIIVLHVITALSSVCFGTYLFFRPSKANFRIYYALIAGTFASGTYLVVTLHSNILHSCAAGLMYLAVVAFGGAAARVRVHARNRSE